MEVELATENLLSAPSAASEEFSKPFKRKSCKYENKCSRFMVEEREYTRQYSHIYYMRLEEMGKRVKSVAERRWGEWRGTHVYCQRTGPGVAGRPDIRCVFN